MRTSDLRYLPALGERPATKRLTRREQRQKRVLGFLACGNSRLGACRLAGASPSMFYDWLKRDGDFLEAVLEAEEECR